jgi:hypothetical protein
VDRGGAKCVFKILSEYLLVTKACLILKVGRLSRRRGRQSYEYVLLCSLVLKIAIKLNPKLCYFELFKQIIIIDGQSMNSKNYCKNVLYVDCQTQGRLKLMIALYVSAPSYFSR